MTATELHTCLRTLDGRELPLPAHRWVAPADDVDELLLERVRGPVLDVGCGPGRHLVALQRRGIAALGIDISPALLAVARRRGATVMQGCVFDRVPAAGRWASALLLDGNIGIGGDPVALLARLAELVHPEGRVHAELAPDGSDDSVRVVRAEHAGSPGPWFRWAVVTPRGLETVARRAGWRVEHRRDLGDRHFVELARR